MTVSGDKNEAVGEKIVVNYPFVAKGTSNYDV